MNYEKELELAWEAYVKDYAMNQEYIKAPCRACFEAGFKAAWNAAQK